MTWQAAVPGPATAALLLCLDTLEVSLSGYATAASQAWAGNAARLLAHARTQGWIVAHVLRRRPDGGARWGAVEGLAPRPFERVFHRDGPSAYSCPEFGGLAAGGAEMVLVGRSNDGALAATASDALAQGLSIAVAADAVAAPHRERARLAAMAQRPPLPGTGGLTIQNVVHLVAAAPRLRLLEGGRATAAALSLVGDGHDL